nr:MAG TPA: hypothetical protein [Caudoviricetes sp.]
MIKKEWVNETHSFYFFINLYYQLDIIIMRR